MRERDKLREAIDASDTLNRGKFAELAGIHESYLSRILNGKQGMSRHVAKRICVAAARLSPPLRLEWHELVDEALDEESEPVSTAAAP